MKYTVLPAYGREYGSRAKVLEDFNSGKDFLAVGFGARGYVSKSELKEGDVVEFRYGREGMKAFVHEVKA